MSFKNAPPTANILFEIVEGGKEIRLGVRKRNGGITETTVPVANLGRVAQSLLGLAAISYHNNPTPLDTLVGTASDLPPLPISRVALGQSANPGHTLLSLGVGEVVLVFEIPNGTLQQLGQAFLAAGADGSRN